jgi:hypothetical protein
MNLNWNAVGAVAELAGALAVVLTLLFLARQIHLSNRQQNLESGRALSEEFNRLNAVFYDLDQTGMILRTFSDWETSTAQEQHVMSMYLMQYVQHMQAMYQMWLNDAIDSSLYLVEEQTLLSTLANPGAAKWWELFQGMYSADYVERIGDLLESTEIVPTGEMLSFWDPRQWPRDA